MGLTKISTAGLEDQSVTLDKLPHGTGSTDGKFLRANNGADPSFETISIPSGTTINNNAVNRVITGSGTANTLNAESDFIVNSSNNIGVGNDASFPVYTHINSRNFMLGHGGESTALQIHSSSTTYGGIYFGDVADSSDANSYIGSIEYKHGDDNMRFRTNGSERMRINNDGSLNIYSTTDGSINLSTTDARGSFIRYQISGTSKVFAGCGEGMGLGSEDDFGIRTAAHLRVRTGAEQHMVVTDEGFLAVKGLAGNFDGSVDPTSKQYHQFNQTGVGKQVAKFRQEHFAGLGTEFAMVSNTGSSEALYVTNSGTITFRVLSNGNVANTNNSYGQISDISLKENVVDSNSQWDDIKAIKVRNFNFKADTEKVNMIGVIAQELETVSPKLVWEDRNGLKNVSYSVLYMKAVKCLQEAQAKIETLETKVAALEAG